MVVVAVGMQTPCEPVACVRAYRCVRVRARFYIRICVRGRQTAQQQHHITLEFSISKVSLFCNAVIVDLTPMSLT